MVVVLMLLMCSCERAAPPAARPGPPQRIASLSPSATEMLFAIGAGDRVVAVSTACDYPPEAAEKAKAGELGTPNLERLLELEVDLLVTTPLRRPEVAARIERAGIRICMVEQRTLEDVYRNITTLGKIAGAEQQANELVAKLRSQEREVVARYEHIPPEKRPSVFLELGSNPLITGGALSFVNDIIEKAGGYNIASSINNDWMKVNPEFVLRQDPDVIILGYMSGHGPGKEEMATRIGWAEIKAVREGRIIDDINPDHLLRPGPRVIEGLKALAERLHPQEKNGEPGK